MEAISVHALPGNDTENRTLVRFVQERSEWRGTPELTPPRAFRYVRIARKPQRCWPDYRSELRDTLPHNFSITASRTWNAHAFSHRSQERTCDDIFPPPMVGSIPTFAPSSYCHDLSPMLGLTGAPRSRHRSERRPVM